MSYSTGESSALDQYETFSWQKGEKEVAKRVKKQQQMNAAADDDDDDLYQDELIKEIEAHENLKGAGTVHGGHHKQFEWCLVCEHDREKYAGQPSAEVQQLIAALKAARLELHHCALNLDRVVVQLYM
eukprot:SAG31_NODE_796_length_12032_cov_21.073242_11_plen_128_part_00